MDRDKLIASLGLAKDATDEQITARINALRFTPPHPIDKVQQTAALLIEHIDQLFQTIENARISSQ